jgi:hypothetical protein
LNPFKLFKILKFFSFFGGLIPPCLDPDPDSQSGSGSVDTETMYKILLTDSPLFSSLSSLEKDRKYLEADLAPATKEKHRRAAVVETSLSISERILLDSVKVSENAPRI